MQIKFALFEKVCYNKCDAQSFYGRKFPRAVSYGGIYVFFRE